MNKNLIIYFNLKTLRIDRKMLSSVASKMQKIKKIKVLGYPFAGGQGKSGVELTPSWL
jgi:hypothetical protein